MKHIKNSYKNEFKKFGRNPKSLFIPKNNQDIRFHSLTRYIKNEDYTLLDYGCGLGDLKKYLDLRFNNYKYIGVDIVEEFILSNQKEDKKSKYFTIKTYKDILEEYDHIVIAGVFNLLYDSDIVKHKKIVYETIEHLFSKTKKTLSINFMSDFVDYKQDKAYHQNEQEIIDFAREKLSKRFILDNSYMPYEFTIVLFKNELIDKSKSIYKEQY